MSNDSNLVTENKNLKLILNRCRVEKHYTINVVSWKEGAQKCIIEKSNSVAESFELLYEFSLNSTRFEVLTKTRV